MVIRYRQCLLGVLGINIGFLHIKKKSNVFSITKSSKHSRSGIFFVFSSTFSVVFPVREYFCRFLKSVRCFSRSGILYLGYGNI